MNPRQAPSLKTQRLGAAAVGKVDSRGLDRLDALDLDLHYRHLPSSCSCHCRSTWQRYIE
jgi:hypothetical protein